MGIWTKGTTKIVAPNSPELQQKVLNAVGLLAKIVGNTLGPSGRPILLERDGLPPLITKDGVTVAKSVNSYDAIENVVIECVKEVADRTGKQAGDGTTTSVILSEAILRYGIGYLQNHPQESPQKFLRDLVSDYNNVIKPAITSYAKEIDNDGMKHIAMMSANGDDVIAAAVVDAILKSGEDGSIIIDEAPGKETKTIVQDGFAFQKGFDFLGSLGSIFVNNEKDMEAVHDRPLIVLFNGTLRDMSSLARITQLNIDSGDIRAMIFVAHDFSEEMKSCFALNTKQGTLKMVPVITPRDGTAMGKDLILQDLAAYTSGKIVDAQSFGKVTLQELGDCDRFRMSRWQTVFIGEPEQGRLAERIDNIKHQMETIEREYDTEIYRERIARLTGGITTINVGGLSDLEVREAKARVEDAVCAVRAALKQGVVPGGGTTMLKLSTLPIHPVLCSALKVPALRLLDNAGIIGTELLTILSSLHHTDQVYDVSKHIFVDPWLNGILDPAKVIDSAIGNALSVAGTLVTLGGVVVVARDINLENQAALSQLAFQNVMDGEK